MIKLLILNIFSVASISGGAVNGDAGSSKKASKRGATKGGKKSGGGKKLFQCDLAKSNRATCRGCHETIIKVCLRWSYHLYSMCLLNVSMLYITY